jgi:hypothetical protein
MTTIYNIRKELLTPRQASKLEEYLNQLSATVYLLYVQPPSTSGRRLLLQHDDATCHGDKDPAFSSCGYQIYGANNSPMSVQYNGNYMYCLLGH